MLEKIRHSIVYQYIAELIVRYRNDDLASMSAQVTYYLILAFPPFLFFLIHLLSFSHLSNRILIANFNLILPDDTANLVKSLLDQTAQDKSGALLLLGIIASLWAASQGMSAVMRGLNHAYDVKETRSFIKRTSIALVSTAGVSMIIIFSFFMIVFGRTAGSYIFALAGEQTIFYKIWPFFRYSISLAFLFASFYVIYKYLPNRNPESNHVMVGTIFATVSWVSASVLFSFYVDRFANFGNIHGNLAGIFALIIWLYISTLIFLLGGELNAIRSKDRS